MPIDFSKVKNAIENAFIDISSLEVATLTNPVTEPINLTDDGDGQGATTTDGQDSKKTKITAGKVLDKIRGSLTRADLAAYTVYEMDGDSINFISQDEKMAELVKQHNELVKSSLETRKAFFTSIVTTVEKFL